MVDLELVRNVAGAISLCVVAAVTFFPLLYRAAKGLARQGVFFGFICFGFLVSMASKPQPPGPPDPPTPVVTNTITYVNTKGAVNANPSTFTEKEAVTFVALADVAGFTFAGWTPSAIAIGTKTNVTVTAAWTAAPEPPEPPTPVVTNTITYVNTKGAVNTNPSTFTEKEAVTFVALADVSGYTFAGWTPSAIAIGTKTNVTVTAAWTATPEPPEPPASDIYEFVLEDGPIEPFVLAVYPADSFKSLKIKGLPTGFLTRNVQLVTNDIAALAVIVSGAPKKAGVSRVSLTKTGRDGSTETTIFTFVVRSASGDIVNAVWDYTRGNVTGPGELKANGKITLKATALKGYVFSGWWDVTTPGESNFVTRLATLIVDRTGKLKDTATQKVVAADAGDRCYRADFITSAEDLKSISARVGDAVFTVGSATTHARAVMAGVSLQWPVTAEALSATSVRVSGLPSGLSYKNGLIAGYPTTASKLGVPSVVKIVVTTAGKNTTTFTLTLTVEALPTWSVGSFGGVSYADNEAETTNGTVSATVAATGKITVKQPVNGKSVSFTAKGFDTYDPEAALFRVMLTAKSGKVTVSNELFVTDTAPLGRMQATLFDAWGYNWKVEPWKSQAVAFKGHEMRYDVLEEPVGTVLLTFAANGTAKVAASFETGVVKSGKPVMVKATGSTTLLPLGDDVYRAYIYLAPRGLTPHARCLDLQWDERAGFRIVEAFEGSEKEEDIK